MHLSRLLQDRNCSGRLIGYFQRRIQVFYKHELSALVELFGCVGRNTSSQHYLLYEMESVSDILDVNDLALPPLLTLRSQWMAPSSQLARSISLSSMLMVYVTTSAYALPSGYQSVSGDVHFSTAGNTMNVTTAGNKAIANYQNFNLTKDETVNFRLPTAQSAILNRVVGGDPSQIMGSINSNGQVFLVNPSGIVFGQTSQVNVGSLYASTLNISDQDFQAGHLSFTRSAGTAPAAVVNHGQIQVQPKGAAVFMGANLQNTGTVKAPEGQIHFAVGDKVTVQIDDSMAVEVTVDEALQQQLSSVDDAITNTGVLQADGGSITLQANLASHLQTRAINNEGLLEARGFENQDGSIVLTDNPDSGATIRNTGTLDASGTETSANGGHILISGDSITQAGMVLAEGAEGGHGGQIELTSIQSTELTSGSVTSTKGAGADSDAGSIRVWSAGDTHFDAGALLDVRGGNTTGDGGAMEVSAGGTVFFDGNAMGAAPHGKAGTLLIDPTDIFITNAGAAGSISILPTDPNNNGADSTFDASTFSGFSSVDLEATNDITVNSAFSLANITAGSSLTLKAGHDINIQAAVSTGGGDINLLADNDFSGSGGAASDGSGGVIINGTGSLSSSGGNITLQGAQVRILSGASVNAGSGDVNIAPSTNKPIRVAGGTDDDDIASGTMDISAPELGRITADSVTIGDTTHSGGLTVTGDIDLSSLGYNISLENAGSIASVDHLFTLGTKTLDIDALGSVSITTSNDNTPIHLTNVTAGSDMTVITSFIGQNNPIIIDGDMVSGGNFLLETYQSPITVHGNITNTSGANTYFYIVAGGDGVLPCNIDGLISVTSNPLKDLALVASGGTMYSNGFFNQSLDFRTIYIVDYSNNMPITLNGNLTGQNVTFYAYGSSDMTVHGSITAAGSLIFGASGNVTVDGDITNTGGAGTSTALVAGREFTLGGNLNITQDPTENLTIQTNTGNIFTKSFFNQDLTFNNLNLQSLGSATPIVINGNVTANGDLSLITDHSDITVTGDINSLSTSGSTLLYGGYLAADSLGDANSGFTLGGQLNITQDASKNIGIITGAGGNIFTKAYFNQGLTFNNISLLSQASSQPITLGGDLIGNDIIVTTNGVNSPITINGSVTAADTLELSALRSNVTVTQDVNSNGTSASVLELNAGYSANGVLQNSAATVSIGNQLNLVQDPDKDLVVWTGSGNLVSQLGSQNLNFRNIDFRTGSANMPLSLTGNLTATSLIAKTSGNNSPILISGTLDVPGVKLITYGNDSSVSFLSDWSGFSMGVTTEGTQSPIVIGSNLVSSGYLSLSALGSDLTITGSVTTLPFAPSAFDPTLWLDASQITNLNNGDPVSDWLDSSGNGNDAIQLDPTRQPIYEATGVNGQAGIYFDGNLKDLAISNYTAGSNTTMFFVVNPDTNQPAGIFDSGPYTANTFRNYNEVGGAGNYWEWWLNSPSIPMNLHASTPAMVEFTTSISGGRHMSYFQDGALMGSGSSASTAPIAWDSPRIGTINGGEYANTNYSGYVSQVLIYDKVLSTEARQSIEKYLGSQYGFSVATTPSHNNTVSLKSGGTMSLSNIDVSGMNITAVTTGSGNIKLNGELTGNNIHLQAAGSILDKNGTANNITATAGATLQAGKTIGLQNNPLEVNVTGGPLVVSVSGKNQGLSANITGVASNGLTVESATPGIVKFNALVVSSGISEIPSQLSTTATDLIYPYFTFNSTEKQSKSLTENLIQIPESTSQKNDLAVVGYKTSIQVTNSSMANATIEPSLRPVEMVQDAEGDFSIIYANQVQEVHLR